MMQEIRHYQQSVGFLIPKLPFSQVIREIMGNLMVDFRIQASALAAIQEAAEAELVRHFEGKFRVLATTITRTSMLTNTFLSG